MGVRAKARSGAAVLCAVVYLSIALAAWAGDEPATPGIAADKMPDLALSVEPSKAGVGEVVYWRVRIKRHPDVQIHLASEASFDKLEIRF